jgi:16S rRNA (uracil1498-N3)-methyltransferase
MTLRLFVELPLAGAAELALPAAAARHVQVRRLQPGAALLLFDGRGGEWAATVTHMGRSEVRVNVGGHDGIERELPLAVTLAVGMPANERMDWLVEKATELGAAALQPLQCERSVLRLDGERAARKVAHWQGVAVAAAEQSGRTRVPMVAPVRTLASWLAGLAGQLEAPALTRLVLSLAPDTTSLPAADVGAQALCLLSGPEGGFDAAELAAARGAGFVPVSLGPRVLRAETAPLAALSWLALQAGIPRT